MEKVNSKLQIFSKFMHFLGNFMHFLENRRVSKPRQNHIIVNYKVDTFVSGR